MKYRSFAMHKNPRISLDHWLQEIEESLQDSLSYLDNAKKIDDLDSRCNSIESAVRENLRGSWKMYVLLKDFVKER